MKIEAEIKNIKNILASDENFYQIPDYQRPYSWDKDNIADLLNDLVEAYLEGKQDKNYFCGSLVLVECENDKRYDIIDGQQRTTTFTIFACVLRDLYSNLFDKKSEKYIYNSIQDEIEENRRKLRFLTNVTNQNNFEQTILKKIEFKTTKNIEKSFPDNRYIQNAHYIKEFFNELLDEHEFDLNDFIAWYYENVVLTVITCPSPDTAIQIFNVLNDRGMPLSPIDILKASLMHKLDNDKEDRRAFLSQWDKINDLLEFNDYNFDNLLTVYLYYKTAANPKNRLDKELDHIFNREKKDSLTIINEIYNFTVAFIDTLGENNRYVYALNYLKHKIYWNSILVTAKYVEYDDIEELKRLLVAYYYQNWIAGATVARIKQTSFNILRHVKNKETIQKIKEEINSNLKKYSTTEKYNDELFSSYVYGKNWDKSVLLVLEYFSKEENSTSFIPLTKKIHVEHILPRTTTEYWDNIFTDDLKEEWTNSISNLTLLSMRKNIQAQNYTFEDKKNIYTNKDFINTPFIITQEIISENSWNEETLIRREKKIEARVKQLFETI